MLGETALPTKKRRGVCHRVEEADANWAWLTCINGVFKNSAVYRWERNTTFLNLAILTLKSVMLQWYSSPRLTCCWIALTMWSAVGGTCRGSLELLNRASSEAEGTKQAVFVSIAKVVKALLWQKGCMFGRGGRITCNMLLSWILPQNSNFHISWYKTGSLGTSWWI